MKIVVTIVVVLLVLIGGAYAWHVWEAASPVAVVSAPGATTTAPSTPASTKLLPANPYVSLSETEFLSKPPASDASAADIARYIKALNVLASSTKVIRMNACRPDVLVVKVASTSSLAFINSGTSTVSLIVKPDVSYKINPSASTSIRASDFVGSSFIKSYGCAGQSGPVGFLYIAP